MTKSFEPTQDRISDLLWFYHHPRPCSRRAREVKDPYLSLVGAVVVQAIDDLMNRDPVQRLSAWTFLTGDAPIWTDSLGLSVERINLFPLLIGRRIQKKIQKKKLGGEL